MFSFQHGSDVGIRRFLGYLYYYAHGAFPSLMEFSQVSKLSEGTFVLDGVEALGSL